MKQFATYIGVPKTTAWGWLNKSTIPPLNKVLDIAYIFDIPMQTLYKECEKMKITPDVLVSDINEKQKKR